jgi:starch-binding outer membrane protein, SusD/RagB family
MKKFKYLIAAAASVAMLFTSCDDFLDTENLTQKDTSNYPKTVTDAQQVIAGIYNNLNVVNANPHQSFLYVSELASDDRLGGGGENDKLMQAEDLLMNYEPTMLEQFWKDRYAGIFRANTAISTLGNCTGYASDDQKNQMLGEAYFLRAFYYYELASLFENIPVVTSADPENKAQSAPADTWGQIISDLKMAIELMPANKFGSGWVEAGHVDHWAAEAMMARAFLFYTGFYGEAGSPLTEVTLPDGSKVTKTDVITWVDDCVDNSGYSLVPCYLNLWAYTNRLTKNDYSYIQNYNTQNPTKPQSTSWVEDDNAVNPESMFAIKFSKFASWSTTIGYSNGYALHFGMRGAQDYAKTFPFGQGWGAGPVAPNLWSDWVAAEPNDPRRAASVCHIPDELPNYTYGGWTDYVQETDYYSKKWAPISAKVNNAYIVAFDVEMYNYTAQYTNMQLCNIHDIVLIRFADVLLMQSELKKEVAGINRVRTRAGLPTIATYTDAALQNERRWELSCEGGRWNDIRRWHIAETALAKQANQPTYYKGVADVNTTSHNGGGYASRYQTTRGFFAIPENQIALSNGVLVQNAGWGSSSAEYTGWK